MLHIYVNKLIAGPFTTRGKTQRVDALATGLRKSVMKPALEKMLRPQADTGWLKLSEALETEIKEAAAKAVPGDVFSCEGAGWMQEAFRMDAVDAEQGRPTTAEEDDIMARDAGRLPLAVQLDGVDPGYDVLTEQQRVAVVRGYVYSQRVGRTCITTLPVSATPSTCISQLPMPDIHLHMHSQEGQVVQIAELMSNGTDSNGVPLWTGKTVDGHIHSVSARLALENFTEQYLDKLTAAPELFFSIPIGRRLAGAPLPRDFPLIPVSCLTSQQNKQLCCVGFGLAAAVEAFGDNKWSLLRDLAQAAVEAGVGVQPADGRGTPAKRWHEIEYYKRHFSLYLRSTYEVHSPKAAAFDVTAMGEHDIAVCQV